MEIRKSYIFFLIITTFGAFLTIRICNAAYAAFDYSDLDSVAVATPHHAAPVIQQPGADGLED